MQLSGPAARTPYAFHGQSRKSWVPYQAQARCGHALGRRDGKAFNKGTRSAVVAVR
jgi:hypothetical protein